MSKAGDYYRLWLRCRKQEICGPQEEAHLAHQKVEEQRDVQMQEAGDGPSQLEKNPHKHTETKIKRNFSQPPLPLNAKNCSYTDFTGKGQKVKEEPTWCLGVAFSGQKAVLPEAHVQLPVSPTSLFSSLPSSSSSQVSHTLKWPQTGETSLCPSGHVTIILIQ